ncbi:hypothetical protein [Xylocopilactobacillus apis]|uniref:Uncharacterized protein n=1 Tax=Xylocopilactobacillus apis TaxID=2932183 RepID=A0AAU9D3T0_9LACO|nr:hypothetical protein [Xylocopilactobacillus apis]BDR56990.1 hypothetical protein KIMC2_15520 [Xylocopilactobacillus apis]
MKVLASIQQDWAAILKKSINDLPEHAVTKNKKIITARLQRKDVRNLLENYNSYFKKHERVKENFISQKDINDLYSNSKKLNLIIKYNQKKSDINYIFTVQLKKIVKFK